MKLPNVPLSMTFLRTGGTYLFPRHLIYLQNILLDVAQGKLKRVIITIPPRHGKSELIDIDFTTWLLMNNPNIRIIVASAAQELPEQFARTALHTFREHSNYDLSVARNGLFKIKGYNGYMRAVGIGSLTTGWGADIFIIDDPVRDPDDARSLASRNRIYEWYRSVVSTRLSKNGTVIIVMTRWHYDDLVGRILENDENNIWTHINLPAYAEDDDPLGREPDEPLWPEMFDDAKLQEKKVEIGAYWFASLYQQRPMSGEFQIFKPENWQHTDSYPNKFIYLVQSWDTAFKDGQRNDNSACVTIGIHDGNFYILHAYKGKLLYNDLKNQLQSLYASYKPQFVFVEDKGSGTSLIQDLKQLTAIPIQAVTVDGDKVRRAHIVSPYFDNGKVFIDKRQDWAKDLIEECAFFPFGAHDDQVDALTQGITKLSKYLISNLDSFVNVMRRNKPDIYSI